MFELAFSVPYYGLDARERIKPGLLLQFFQEAAALHADSVNIGVADLLKNDMTWVLRRYRVHIRRYPGMGALTVRTWFEPQKNLMSVRRFELLDAAGEAVADAWSGWIVVDLKKGRPVRLDRALPASYYAAVDDTGEPVREAVEPVGADVDLERRFHVRWSELDLNGHTNHTVYFEWALESVPDDVRADCVPVQLDAEYLSSATREWVGVRSRRTSEVPLRFLHSVAVEAGGVEAARLASTWEKID